MSKAASCTNEALGSTNPFGSNVPTPKFTARLTQLRSEALLEMVSRTFVQDVSDSQRSRWRLYDASSSAGEYKFSVFGATELALMCEWEEDEFWLNFVDLGLFLRDLRETCVHSWESLGDDILVAGRMLVRKEMSELEIEYDRERS